MWFWSVSWSINCPVFFSFFLVNQKKFVQSQGIFGQSLIFFGKALIFFFSLVWKLVTLWYQRVTKLQTRLTKKNQRLTKNSLRLDNFFLVNQKKWEKDWTIGWPRDWPKPHGRDYKETPPLSVHCQLRTGFFQTGLARNKRLFSISFSEMWIEH